MNWNKGSIAATTLLALWVVSPVVAQEMVDNPTYKSWAAHKPGTEVVMDLQTVMGEMKMTMELTHTLLEVNAEKAVVETTAKANIPGVPAGTNPPKQKHTFNAQVPKSELDKSKLPPGVTGDIKEVGKESIDVAGKTHECTVSEFKGGNEGGEQTGKIWNSADIPGGMGKMTATGKTAAGDTSLNITVKSITAK